MINYELVGFVEGSKRSIRGKEHNSGSDKKDNDTDIKYNFMFSNEGSKKYLLKKERKV